MCVCVCVDLEHGNEAFYSHYMYGHTNNIHIVGPVGLYSRYCLFCYSQNTSSYSVQCVWFHSLEEHRPLTTTVSVVIAHHGE